MKSAWSTLESILAAAVFVLTLLALFLIAYHRDWVAVAVIGTVGAVAWAICYQGITEWLQRPKLEIVPLKSEQPHLLQILERAPDDRIIGVGCHVGILIRNRGNTMARHCQPVVTAVGQLDGPTVVRQENWLPSGLRWSLGQGSRTPGEPSNGERDLIPHRPYYFSLGSISTMHPDHFRLSGAELYKDQEKMFMPGQYCFEVTVFAERSKPVRIYLDVEWKGAWTGDMEDVGDILKVWTENHPPW